MISDKAIYETKPGLLFTFNEENSPYRLNQLIE